MESSQHISEEWGSLYGLHTTEEADFMAQLFGEKHYGNTTLGFWPGNESTTVTIKGTDSNSYFLSNVTDINLCFLQGSSCSIDTGNSIFSTTSSGPYSCDPATNFDSVSMAFCLGDAQFSPHSFQCNDNSSQQINENTDEESSLALADNNLQAKREYEMMVSEHVQEVRSGNLENLQGFGCFSQGDSSASLKPNGGASKDPAPPNLLRKSRASNGPATDPQSLED